MTDRPAAPRIPPLPEEERDDFARELLTKARAGTASNIFTTLVRHPGLFRHWTPFAGKLLNGGKLPARTRELAILRSAWLCRCAYEWSHHVSIGKRAGLSDDEIERVADGADAEGWDPPDALVLRAVDELHNDNCLSDVTWEALAAGFDERQMIELPMLVGHYHLLAFALNSMGVQPEPGLPALPAR